MGLLSADALRKRESPEFTIDLGDGEVRARRPDLQMLVFKGLIPTPILNDVVKLIGQWVGTQALTDLTEDLIENSDKMLTFANQLICEALIEPRVTMERDASPECLWIEDLTMATRKRLMTAIISEMVPTPKGVVEAATEFPENGPSAGAGPDVPEVLPAPV